MKITKLGSKYFNRTKDFCSTRNPEINYNEIIINPSKSFQPTETAGFEFPRFVFATSSLQIQCCVTAMFRWLKLNVMRKRSG